MGQVVPNETVTAVDIEGADVLPAKLIEDEFKDQHGQPLNFARVEKSRHTIDNWYRDRYLDGMVPIFSSPLPRNAFTILGLLFMPANL